MYDIIIIGCGPSGMTAAIYARRANKNVLVLEAKTYGGQIINTLDIENYPCEEHISGFDFSTKLYNQVINLGAEVKLEEVINVSLEDDIKVIKTTDNTYKTKALIIATGVKNRTLGISNEKKLIGKGISYCATCDGAFFKGKITSVVGGGNTALEDALYLSDIAEKVYLIHRRDQFRADEILVDKVLKKDNIEIIYNSNIIKINGIDKLESIDLDNNKNIKTDALFIAVGQVPNNDIFKDLIDLDDNGYIISDNCITSAEGIYAAGDNRVKELRQLVTATSDGAIAANLAIKYLNK